MMVGNETTLDELDLSEVAREQVGPYELVRRLGSGGMAEVHLARALGIEGFEKLVVLKRILPHLSADQRFIRMFLAEARLAAILDHPNIVQVFDLGHDAGEYYFTMELVYGENLQNILRAARRTGAPFPIEHGITIAIGVAAGLHYAHERVGFDGKRLGLVHRDVSPTNVMVTYEGCAKVADFGIAKVMNRTDVTQAGMRKGKVPYMSPEQCRAEPLDPRSDVFSLGIVLYEATTMQRLFEGENEFGIMNRIVNGDIPSPTSVRPGYPKDLERIVLRALSVDKHRRHASARELQLDLENFVRERKLACSQSALGDYLHRLFAPQPFPWGALLGEEASTRPSAVATVIDVGQGSSSAAAEQPTPASVPSYVRPTYTTLGSMSLAEQRRTTLKGVAIGLSAAAAMAVLSVGGLWVLTRESDAVAGPVEPEVEAVEAPSASSVEAEEAAVVEPVEAREEPEVATPQAEREAIAEADPPEAEPEPPTDAQAVEPANERPVAESVSAPKPAPQARPQTETKPPVSKPAKKKRKPDPDAFWPE